MGYKFCKFCENRERDTPCGAFIFHILVKSEFLGSYTLVVEPMGVKSGMEEGIKGPSSMPNFTPIGMEEAWRRGPSVPSSMPNFTPIRATCLKIGL